MVSVSQKFSRRSPLFFSGTWHKSFINLFEAYHILIVVLIVRYWKISCWPYLLPRNVLIYGSFRVLSLCSFHSNSIHGWYYLVWIMKHICQKKVMIYCAINVPCSLFISFFREDEKFLKGFMFIIYWNILRVLLNNMPGSIRCVLA